MVAVWQRQWDITTKHIVRHIHLHQSQESMLLLTWQRNKPPSFKEERLREFHDWFPGYEQRELTPEQATIEEKEFQSIVNEAFPSKKETI